MVRLDMLGIMSDNTALVFKSIPEMYEKEKDGRKPNTLREVEKGDKRLTNLTNWPQFPLDIIIINTESGEHFRREITDITFWKGWWLISWKNGVLFPENNLEVDQTKDGGGL